MLQKILVAIDHSDTSKFVFDEALALAKATGAQLRVLEVVSPEEETAQDIALYFDLESYPANVEEHTAYIEHRFGWYITKAARTGVKTQFFQYLGDPGEVICNFVSTWKNDLIVIGRRGHSGFSRMLLGSVSNYVVHHAPCSVHIVHYPEQSSSEVVQSEPVQARS